MPVRTITYDGSIRSVTWGGAVNALADAVSDPSLPVSTTPDLAAACAYKAEMREADGALIAAAALFVDSRETMLGQIGVLDIPIARGVISPEHVRGGLYDLIGGGPSARASDQEITVFKNGGGAHLDLMIAQYLSNSVAR